MAATSLLPKSITPFLTNPPSISPTHITNITFFNFPPGHHHSHYTPRQTVRRNAKKKNSWLDPFDYGDDPEMENGSLFSEGKQEEDPRPPDNPDNPYGFLKFPMGYSVEVASLGLKIRGDVRRCCCVVSGGVYENLLFFPTIQLIKNRYPGVQVDVIASARISYIYPNVNSAGAGLLLSETFTPDRLNLSEGGFNMYHQMIDWLGRPARGVPREEVPPLKVSISRKLKEVVAAKCKDAGVEKGKYIVVHGIESDSKASMQSRGDTDSLLPLHAWAEITKAVRPVFVIPHEKERENVEDIVGDDTSIVFITTPGQLAALINDSIGVISTNTAALQLANARDKPCVALFASEEKGKLFVPNPEEKRCIIVSSKTGKLGDIDNEAVKNAAQIFEMPLALV